MALGAKRKSKDAFRGIIEGVLGERTIHSALKPRCNLEIGDLECLTEKEEVEEAVKRKTLQNSAKIK